MKKQKLLAATLALSLALPLLTGCQSNSSSSQSTDSSQSADVPTVVMYYPLPSIPTDQEMVAEEINKYVMEKLNINLVLEPVTVGSYQDQLNLITAGSEQVDLALMFGSDLSSYAAKGALLEIDDLLEEYGQGISESLGDYLDAGAINGVSYQVPVNRSMFTQSGVVLRKDILEKYNIDYTQITDEEDLTAAFEIIKAGEPDMAMIQPESSGDVMLFTDYDSLGDSFGVLMDYGQSDTVVNLFATDEFAQACELHRDWYEKGYIPADALTNTEGAASLVKNDKLLGFTCTVGPGTEQDKTNQCGKEMVIIPLRKAFSYTSKANLFGWSILRNSANPEAAMQVLNLMYSDPTFLNMLDWGLEGVHYKMVEGSERIITFADGVDADTSGYFHNFSYAFGDQLKAYFWQGTEEDFPEQVSALNKSSILSNAMGFSYDVTPVKAEYTAVSNVYNEYAAALTMGCIDPEENLPAFLDALESAGISKIIAEKQSQYDAWLEAKNS